MFHSRLQLLLPSVPELAVHLHEHRRLAHPQGGGRAKTATRKQHGVDRIAISGGECTLNRRWLVQYLSHLRN